MNKYLNAAVYKIINNDYPELIYIGSTTDFRGRGYQHKADCNHPHRLMHNTKIYKTIREHGGWDSWEMIKICDYPCENRTQLEQEEGRQIKAHCATLNVNRSYTSPEVIKEQKGQYTIDNKELIYQKNKEYYQRHKERLRILKNQYNYDNKERIKQYHLNHSEHKKALEMFKFDCACGGRYTHINVNTHRKTQRHINFINPLNDNKEKIKQYRIDNKEKERAIHNCICGVNYTRDHRSRHNKTKKHINFINQPIEQ
jgi:hypothetical protein